MNLAFACPKCRSNQLEERVLNVTQSSIVDAIGLEGDDMYLEYGKFETEGGDNTIFQCAGCGHKIAESEDNLKTWLLENQ